MKRGIESCKCNEDIRRREPFALCGQIVASGLSIWLRPRLSHKRTAESGRVVYSKKLGNALSMIDLRRDRHCDGR
jgi:hypothetical protein